jgi:hypothetical protein
MTTPHSARDAIANLLGTYCECMDAGDWAGIGALFADGELVGPDGAVIAAGSAAVVAMYERGTRLYDGSPGTRHVTANSIFHVDGDTATVRSSYVVFQAVPGALPLQPIISGRYRDTFRSAGGAWQFARRQFFADHVGDLSHHLTYEVPS